MLKNGNVKSNYLYVVSSDVMDMNGERITNLGEGTELSDALPMWQIDRDYVSKTSLSSDLSTLGYEQRIETLETQLSGLEAVLHNINYGA